MTHEKRSSSVNLTVCSSQLQRRSSASPKFYSSYTIRDCVCLSHYLIYVTLIILSPVGLCELFKSIYCQAQVQVQSPNGSQAQKVPNASTRDLG